MKQAMGFLCVVLCAVSVYAQDNGSSDSVAGADLLNPLWQMEDAVPIPTGEVSLRIGFQWETASFPSNQGDSDDNFIITPTIFWGSSENVEVSVKTPVWLGDGGNAGALEEGNADTTIGVLWRFADQFDLWPAMAVKGSIRIPTGDNTNSVDGELRLLLTNNYDSGIRSHVNGFVQSIGSDNREAGSRRSSRNLRRQNLRSMLRGRNSFGSVRDFQWGVVIGMDGPLCMDGAVRWVFDYMHRSSVNKGSGDINQVELGWQWAMENQQSLGMAVQVGLDGVGDTGNFGAGFNYAFGIGA